MTMKTMFRLAAGFIIPAALLLAGCGGSGSSSVTGSAVSKVTGTASEGVLITGKAVKQRTQTVNPPLMWSPTSLTVSIRSMFQVSRPPSL